MKVKSLVLAGLLLGAAPIFTASIPDEGMFPLSELSRAGLKKAGLKISEKDIYNPGQIGLVDALVQVSGCTGSFVSPNGLIITNHHCAFSAVQLASTPEHNYLENGFIASTLEQEIEAKGLTIRITDSYEDVSVRVLNAVANITDPIERINTIKKVCNEIAKEAEAKDPSIKAEVSEMFIGKSYVLFRYKTIEDVRLVYVPRQDIGEFGGETDNWVWPRHTGDFSFLRAYVGPDGKPAKYSKNNVPYKPKKHLKVNPKGVEENDFVFILGYPGRTFRHRPAQFIEYQQQFLLPYVSELYDFQNQQMLQAGKEDKAIELALATRVKRNANVLKNYRGKLKGLRNIDLIGSKKKEDTELATFIQSKPELKSKYGTLMEEIDKHYQLVFSDAMRELWFNNMYTGIRTFQIARVIQDLQQAVANQSKDADKKRIFESNKENVLKQLSNIFESYHLTVDKNIAGHMFAQAYTFQDKNTIEAIKTKGFTNAEAASTYIQQAIQLSKLTSLENIKSSVLKDYNTLASYSDEVLKIHKDLVNELAVFRKELTRREGILNRLMGDYVAVKEIYQAKNFIPDANSTLRLTFGNIKGYSPADATYMAPFTSIKGLIEKGNSGLPEFRYPQAIKEAWEKKDFGPYVRKKTNEVPVNMLYNMDTTGGNSGSPVMNAYGELVGVNFDRSYDATINDFAWNESYSRSIGVDIRYILWIADKIDKAHFILKEMGI